MSIIISFNQPLSHEGPPLPPDKEWLQGVFTVELQGVEILTILGHLILALKHPDNKGPSSKLARRIGARLTNLVLTLAEPELIHECRTVFEIGQDFDADYKLCLQCGNLHPPDARCEFYA